MSPSTVLPAHFRPKFRPKAALILMIRPSIKNFISLTHGMSVESLQPELYAQTSTESVPEESVDGCETEAEASLAGTSAGGSAPLGEIHFSVVYDFAKKNLIVKVIEARQLPRPANKSTNQQLTSHTAVNGHRKSNQSNRSNP